MSYTGELKGLIMKGPEKAELRNDSEFRYWLVRGVWEIALQLSVINSREDLKQLTKDNLV